MIKTPSKDEDWENLLLAVLAESGVVPGFEEFLRLIHVAFAKNSIVVPNDFAENKIRQAFTRLQGKSRIAYESNDSIRLISI